MLTYVINTSENKTFDNNLLFELVGYSQIRWKHCSLRDINLCAEEICDEERSKILSTGEYRVVVLVDFFGFPKADPTQSETASEYVEIYKAFLEHYLLENLFYALKKKNIPAKACDIYYIQYVAYEPLAVNNLAMAQTAELLSMPSDLVEALKPAVPTKHADSYIEYEDDLLEEEKKPQAKKAKKADPDDPLQRKFSEFVLTCANGVELPFSFKRSLTFQEFFTLFSNHRDDARKFGVVTHKPYVTYGDASRAAYDALSLSLYLVYLYERRDDVEPNAEIRRMDDRAFVTLLRSSLRKIHSARNMALNNECRYYKLDFERKSDAKPEKAAPKEEKRVKAKKLTDDEKFREICSLADHNGGAHSESVRNEINELMKKYLRRRDDARDRAREGFEKDRAEIDESRGEMQEQCPSDIDLKMALDDKKEKISELLRQALEADYNMQDFSEEKERAVVVYKKYKQARACEARNIFGDVVFLLLTLVGMLAPYYLMQLMHLKSSILQSTMLMLGAGVFGGLFVLIFLWRITRSVNAIRRYRQQLNKIYEACRQKNSESLAEIRRCYEHVLIEIEELRQNMREIYTRDALNREKNRHVEMHRETLEHVENLLSGMLNSFGERPNLDTVEEDVRGEFKIDKPITAAENKVYKIFSMDAIDMMFKQKGDELQDD